MVFQHFLMRISRLIEKLKECTPPTIFVYYMSLSVRSSIKTFFFFQFFRAMHMKLWTSAQIIPKYFNMCTISQSSKRYKHSMNQSLDEFWILISEWSCFVQTHHVVESQHHSESSRLSFPVSPLTLVIFFFTFFLLIYNF